MPDHNREVALDLIAQNYTLFPQLCPCLKNDIQLVETAMAQIREQNGILFCKLADLLRDCGYCLYRAYTSEYPWMIDVDFAFINFYRNESLCAEARCKNIRIAGDILHYPYEFKDSSGYAHVYDLRGRYNTDLDEITDICINDLPDLEYANSVSMDALQAHEKEYERIMEARDNIHDALSHHIENHALMEFADDGEIPNGEEVCMLSHFLRDYETCLEMVKQDGNVLASMRDIYDMNKTIVMAAVAQNGLALKYANSALRNDYNIVRIAVEQNGLALKYANVREQKETLFSNFGQYASRRDTRGYSISANYGIVDNVINNDVYTVMMAVMQNGLALEYASAELKKDKLIITRAYMQNKDALKFASADISLEFLYNMEIMHNERAPSLNHTHMDIYFCFTQVTIY